jgi:hypothetical protein
MVAQCSFAAIVAQALAPAGAGTHAGASSEQILRAAKRNEDLVIQTLICVAQNFILPHIASHHHAIDSGTSYSGVKGRVSVPTRTGCVSI